MTAASFEQVTDAVGVALAIAMVALFALVDLLPTDRLSRKLSSIAAGSVFTLLVVLVAYRFVVLAE